MKFKRTPLVALFCSLFIQSNVWAQDEHLSQFYQNEAAINPSFTGNTDGAWRLSANSKKQWGSVAAPFSTSVFFVDGNFISTRKMSFAGGLGFVADKAGNANFKSRHVLLNLASKIKMNRNQDFAAGIQVGYIQKSIDINDFSWDAQYNGKNYDASLNNRETANPTTFNNFGIAAGLAYLIKLDNYKKLKFGISAFHLNANKNSFYNVDSEKLYARFSFFINGEFAKPKTNMAYLPSLLIQKQGPSYMLVPGMLMSYRMGYDSRTTNYNSSSALMWGFHYRFGDAIIPSIHFEYHRKLRAGISYDINLSQLTPASKSRGGVEISLNYFIFKR
jgi:type IX secretion system PorP/SprF family membrane protein